MGRDFIAVKGVDGIRKALKNFSEAEIRKTKQVALNKTAGQVKSILKASIPLVFDRPKAFTKNSLFILTAQKTGNETALVKIKDEASGVPPVNFLGPHILGGPRNHKAHEVALKRIGVLKGQEYIVPGVDAAIDKWGNQRSSQIIKIMSQLGAFNERPGYGANASKPKDGWSYFVSKDRKSIFRVKKNRVQVLMYIVDDAIYAPKWKFYEIGLREGGRLIVENTNWAIEKAFEKARNRGSDFER